MDARHFKHPLARLEACAACGEGSLSLATLSPESTEATATCPYCGHGQEPDHLQEA